MHELSLVVFTVLAQSAVGLFLVLACLLMFNNDSRRQHLLNKLLLARPRPIGYRRWRCHNSPWPAVAGC